MGRFKVVCLGSFASVWKSAYGVSDIEEAAQAQMKRPSAHEPPPLNCKQVEGREVWLRARMFREQ
jgi:hypothetical protein